LFVGKNKDFEKYVLPETFDQILEYHEAARRLQYERITILGDKSN
jgi:hypothetical protein